MHQQDLLVPGCGPDLLLREPMEVCGPGMCLCIDLFIDLGVGIGMV